MEDLRAIFEGKDGEIIEAIIRNLRQFARLTRKEEEAKAQTPPSEKLSAKRGGSGL